MFYNFSFEDLIKCVEREIAMRERVYPSRVATAKMTQGQADREIAMMKDIRHNLFDLLLLEKAKEAQEATYRKISEDATIDDENDLRIKELPEVKYYNKIVKQYKGEFKSEGKDV